MAKKIILALIVLSLLWLIINYSFQLKGLWQAGQIIEKKKEELRLIQEQNSQLKKDLERVQSLEFVEYEAREKLGMAKEDERVLIMPELIENQIGFGQDELPVWRSWWRLFVY